MYVRKWLNKEGRAFIEIDAAEYGNGGDVTIADCERRIQLDFAVYDNKEFKPKLAKLDLIIESLQAFRDHLRNQQVNKK